jgi:hypothetical protein
MKMRIRKITLLFFVLALSAVSLVLCAFTMPAHAAAPQNDLITVEAEGFAPIGGSGKSAAREAARRSAYRDALEKAVGATVHGVTEMKNYEVVRDKVFSQTQGIVKNFDIVREWEDDDGVLYITAICKVSFAALDGVLGPAVLDALGNPRVMVLIDERIDDTQSFLSTTEGEVLRVFEKAGYYLVDPGQSELLKDINLNEAKRAGDPEQMRDIARTFRADVLVFGKAYASAFTKQKISGVNIIGGRSTVQLRAVLSNSAQMLGSDTIEEKTICLNKEDGAIKGFKIAASIAGKSLVHKIAYSLVSGSAGGIPGRTVNVKITNIAFKTAREIKDFLDGTDGVTGTYQRSYRSKVLELDVTSDKTAEDLADLLSDYGIDIEDITSATVEGRAPW